MTATTIKPSDIGAICRKDPLAFGRAVLGRVRWSGQKAIRLAIEKHRRVRLQSGNATGKTHEVAADIFEYLARGHGRRAILTGPSFDQVHRGLWTELQKTWDDAAKRGVKIGQRPGETEWKIGPGHGAFIASVDNISSIQGGRGTNGTFVAVDEAQGVEDANLWTALDSAMQHPSSRFVTLCNPLYPEGVDYENSLNDEWHTVILDALRHPNVVTGRMIIPGAVSKIWVDECRRRWGEDDHRWHARILGQYPSAGSNALFSRATIERAAQIEPTQKDGRHMGVDIAGPDGDENVAYLVEDRKVLDCETWTGIDLMGTTGHIVQLMRRWSVQAPNVHIDETGIGAGVPSRLREQGHAVDGVNFGSSPSGDWADVLVGEVAANRRVELYITMAQLFRDGQFQLPEKFDLAKRDLCATRLKKPRSDGAVMLEEKDAIKKRIGRSPDHGDSLVLALSRSGGGSLFGFA